MNTGHGVNIVKLTTGRKAVCIPALLLLLALTGCAMARGTPEFEFTGTVYDAVTKQPIEGAYVFASYRKLVGVNSRCYKTRGMYTGKDGKYRFPIEQLDGLSPWLTSAIKPGYYFVKFDTPTREVWDRQDASSYSNRHIYLNPQDPAKPNFLIGTGEEFCFGATTTEYATAGTQFLRIELAEYLKYGAGEQRIEAKRSMIESLETIGSNQQAREQVGAREGK